MSGFRPLFVLALLLAAAMSACRGDAASDATTAAGPSPEPAASASAVPTSAGSTTGPAATAPPASATPAPAATTPAIAQPTAAPSGGQPPAPAPATGSALPDGQRILSYVRRLADDIGPRPAGTAAEQAAIDFISAQLRGFGYEVSVQDFSIGTESNRESTVTITSSAQRTIASLPFGRSAASTARGRLVSAGRGSPAEFPVAVSGNIALIERGDLTFQDKLNNAVAAGAIGVLIFNNETGNFLGSLSQNSPVPAASISQSDGLALRNDLQGGSIDAQITVGAIGSSVAHNVIARPPGKECETVTGGHFDSVIQAPGASDNATGTATTIEIAGVMARNGQMGSNCFALWGAEELGLIGSRAYVNSLTPQQRQRLKAVINLDMVGVGNDTWLLIGNSSLQTQMVALANQLGIEARPGQLSGAASDHVSFINAGIAAVMIYRTQDNLLHTPQDVSSRVRPELLEQAARLAIALLQSLAAGGG